MSGFPADAVNYALEVLQLTPDLVVSGSNAGQNMGVVAPASGTVGAARTAVRLGYPAVAVSQGLDDRADYSPSVDVAADWISLNRAALSGSAMIAKPIAANATLARLNAISPRGLSSACSLKPRGGASKKAHSRSLVCRDGGFVGSTIAGKPCSVRPIRDADPCPSTALCPAP